MSSSMLEDLANYLELGGFGSNQNENRTIFTDLTPDRPDDCIVLQRYGGMPPERVQDKAGIAYEKPSVQIKVRSAVYDSGDDLIERIFDFVILVKNAYLGGTYYRGIIPMQTPFFLKRDDNKRNEFIFNCRVEKERKVV